MKRLLYLILILTVSLAACAGERPTESPGTPVPAASATMTAPPKATPAPTASPTPGKVLTVLNTQDKGENSLRDLLDKAGPGDQIVFDPTVFSPQNPKEIRIQSSLIISKDGITIDASDTGVILDGSEMPSGVFQPALGLNSSHNTVRGLKIQHFSGPGLMIDPGSQSNLIGGDRSIGSNAWGQGNVILFCDMGINLMGSDNIIQGNLIGTDLSSEEDMGNSGAGISVEDQASRNVIGPNNVIAFTKGQAVTLKGSDNIIQGNQIGTDASGKMLLGNRHAGIAVTGAASRNTIGPGNIIAHNAKESINGGVDFSGGDALDNRVTQNQMFDNSALEITYNFNQGKPVIPLTPPAILSADLSAGKVSGVACPGCLIELFSTNAEKIQMFEGEATADANGQFLFEKPGGFSGRSLEATAYIKGQNTSEFSIPVMGTLQNLVFQPGNQTPMQVLSYPVYADLLQNKLGSMHYVSCDNPDTAADYMHNATTVGEKWMRVNVEWYDWPEVVDSGQYSDFEISPCQDQAIDLLSQNGVELMYTLTYWDPQITVSNGYSRFRDDAEIERFLEFTKFIVTHFQGKIKRYSLLNEPNLTDGQRAVKVEDYIRLAHRVIPVIHAIDPDAKIVIGEVTPLIEPGAPDYLLAIVRSDLMPLVDGIVWHGFSGNTPDYEPAFFNAYPGMVKNIVDTAREHGFAGEFYATELQYRTSDTNRQRSETHKKYVYSDMVAVKYYARGHVFHRGQDFWVAGGHEESERVTGYGQLLTRLSGLFSGAQAASIPATSEPNSKNAVNYSFTLPDGSTLLAVWNNVQAKDVDEGILLTLTLPDIKADELTAIDPIYGYQQTLQFEMDQTGIVIKNFLLKDYPIFIHIKERKN